MQFTPTSVDLAKSVFQVSVADAQHHIEERKRLSRSQFERFLINRAPMRLIMEGCASAHHWARFAQSLGHEPKLLHAKYVRPFVRRNKTDAADADALIRADADPDLKPIAIKSLDQQAIQSLHRIRELWKKDRTARINEARSLLAEFGLILPKGTRRISFRLRLPMDKLPPLLQPSFSQVVDEINQLEERLAQIDRTLKQIAQANPVGARLLTVTGIGPTIASAALGRVSDMQRFPRGRSFSSWLGLTPRETSSGNRRRLGRISSQGDTYLRTLLIHGARSALLSARRKRHREIELTRLEHWALKTERRVGFNKATVALANKMARIIWAIWTQGKEFDGNHACRYD